MTDYDAPSPDAEHAARPAGDEPEAWWSPSNGYIVPTEPGWPEDAPKRVRVRDRRVLHEMPSDAVHLAAAAPRAGADTASLKAGDTVPVRWLDRAGYHYGTGEIVPADGDIRPLRVTLRRRDRRNEMPSADFADSVPRGPVAALLTALDDIDAHRPQTVDLDTAVAEVRRHLDALAQPPGEL